MQQLYKQIFGLNIPSFSISRFITLIKKRFYPTFIKVRNEHIVRSINLIIFLTCALSLSYLIYNSDNILYSHYKFEPTEKITKTVDEYKCCNSDYYYPKYNLVGKFTQIDGWTTHDVIDVEIKGELCKHKFNPETNILKLPCSAGVIAGYVLLIIGLVIASAIYIIQLIIEIAYIKEFNLSYQYDEDNKFYTILWFFVSTKKTGVSTLKYISLYIKTFFGVKTNLQDIIYILTNQENNYFNKEKTIYANIDDESYKYIIQQVVYNNREDNYIQLDIDMDNMFTSKDICYAIAKSIQNEICRDSFYSLVKERLSYKETVEFIINYYPLLTKDICEK
jgi:hypothetical protein